jgi:vacuolar protein sorting-associated protein 13A/C
LSAREHLDLNLSTTFVELAITTLSIWNKGEHILQKARGTYAPYRIRNQTGAPIFVWSDIDSSAKTKDIESVKILHDQTIDWRFDDWKTMREVSEPNLSFYTSPIQRWFSTYPQGNTILVFSSWKNLGNS